MRVGLCRGGFGLWRWWLWLGRCWGWGRRVVEVAVEGRPDSALPRLAGADVVVRVLPWEGVGMGRVVADPDGLLSGPEVAELLGISGPTWRNYVLSGLAPKPVEPDVVRADGSVKPVNLRRPRWSLSQVREYRQDPRRNPKMRRGAA